MKIDRALGSARDQLSDLVAVALPFLEEREDEELRAPAFQLPCEASVQPYMDTNNIAARPRLSKARVGARDLGHAEVRTRGVVSGATNA